MHNWQKLNNPTPISQLFWEGVGMDKASIVLTSPELSGLWNTYLQNSAVECVLKHFLTYVQDSEIKPVVQEAAQLARSQLEQIEGIFTTEGIPVPTGLSDQDVHLPAPPLYTDLFALSFVYRVGQINLHHFGATSTKVARDDVEAFFFEGLESVTKLYKKSLHVMLSKGIYDRPPKIDYPDKSEYIREQSFLGKWFGEKRALSALELGEIFFVIERNYIGLLLLLGLIQVVEDKEIKQYLIRGKELSEKQINIFNQLLREEELLEISPVTMEVTDSRISPFSDKLIMLLITTTTATSISLLAYAMSVSMRKDLIAHYSRIMAEVMLFGEDGMNILIERGWMEQPPLAFNRKAIMKV